MPIPPSDRTCLVSPGATAYARFADCGQPFGSVKLGPKPTQMTVIAALPVQTASTSSPKPKLPEPSGPVLYSSAANCSALTFSGLSRTPFTLKVAGSHSSPPNDHAIWFQAVCTLS